MSESCVCVWEGGNEEGGGGRESGGNKRGGGFIAAGENWKVKNSFTSSHFQKNLPQLLSNKKTVDGKSLDKFCIYNFLNSIFGKIKQNQF